jgi:hypothetical protein
MDPNILSQFQFLPFFPPEVFSPNLESAPSVDSSLESEAKGKTRGRKKLRPGNPLKTEVLDKFWLRAFKNFIKANSRSLNRATKDKDFWTWYCSRGKPGRKSSYLSYNSSYKEKLFRNSSFCSLFTAWAMVYGLPACQKKILKVPWEFYFEYLMKELMPKGCGTSNEEEFGMAYQFVLNNFVEEVRNGEKVVEE